MRISDLCSYVCSSDLSLFCDQVEVRAWHVLGRAIQQPLREHADRPPVGHAHLAVAVGDAGDVQVRPALALGEARQEAAGGDRAGPATAEVVAAGVHARTAAV